MKLSEQRLIFKIESADLKKSKWNMNINLAENPDSLITIGESQLIRWIDQIRENHNVNNSIREIKRELRKLKKQEETPKLKAKIKQLYNELYQLKFLPDLLAVVFPANKKSKDYDRANEGFTVNGIKYRRLLGTSGGIKKCTIFYIAEDLHAELMRRIENGRDLHQKMVPAKLEAYRALTCSGSVPIPKPKGIIVVNDCVTAFKENVIVIDDSKSVEPRLSKVDGYNVIHNNSDGFGLMLPAYAARVNQTLANDSTPLSGMVIRYAFTKGMLVTFDFVDFAEQIAGDYIIKDVWGVPRDIREAEVILTESQLKLWSSYKSWEDFEQNAIKNQYEFGVTKTCPMELEPVHTTNYQFLQPYQFTDEEIIEMCSPTLEEIKDVISLDYRKSIVYLGGDKLKSDCFENLDDNIIKALMINPDMINDPYVQQKIEDNIAKQIERTKRGKIAISANYSMIVGDPYALMQSVFGLPVTGLLKAGETYHKFWSDKGAKEIVSFRAPMSVANNQRLLKPVTNEQVNYWFRYIKTVCILNAWDSTFEASNGADADGDTFYCTDNPIIVRNTNKLPTIICLQNNAPKIIPDEAAIVAANKISFSDKIGSITNTVTEMYDIREQYSEDSAEYKELSYRIMCGQHLQQGEIDRAKGAEVKPMPGYWKQLKPDEEYTDLQRAIVADKKPYFFRYVYPSVNAEYLAHTKKYHELALKMCGVELEELPISDRPEAAEILYNYRAKSPVTDNGCTVNKIAHYVEKEMQLFNATKKDIDFDYTILKTPGIEYTTRKFNAIKSVYEDYLADVALFKRRLKYSEYNKEEVQETRGVLIEMFKSRCAIICPNEAELTNILIDMIYPKKNTSKSFVWLICGDQIIDNLLKYNNYEIKIPIKNANGDFTYNGEIFKMTKERMILND